MLNLFCCVIGDIVRLCNIIFYSGTFLLAAIFCGDGKISIAPDIESGCKKRI